jgi:hypothetical protein
MWSRLLDWAYRRVGAYRVSRGTIADAVERGVRANASTPAEVVNAAGMSAGQSIFNAVMVFAKLVADRSDQLAALTTALAAARTAHRTALVAAARYLQRTDIAVLTAAREAVDRTRYEMTTTLRRLHVTPRAYFAMVTMVFAFDSWVFWTMYMDLFDADPGQPVLYWLTVGIAAAGALITPMAVLWVADQAGARLARLNVELRAWFDEVDAEPLKGRTFSSMFAKSILLVLALLALSALFVLIAVYRFGEHSAGLGAVVVPTWLTATLMGMLPAIATAFAFSRRDLRADHRNGIDTAWTAHEQSMARNAQAISDTMLAWEENWRALYSLVGQIVAEANLSIQNVEHLVLYAMDRVNLGGAAPFRTEVVANRAGWSSPRYQAMLDGAATGGSYVVNTPAQLSSIELPVPPWVQDALEITLQALAVHLPGVERRTQAEVEDILLRAFGIPGASLEDAEEVEEGLAPEQAALQSANADASV